MGCRSTLLAVRCNIAGPIAAKQRKEKRKGKQSSGYSILMEAIDSNLKKRAGDYKHQSQTLNEGNNDRSGRGRRRRGSGGCAVREKVIVLSFDDEKRRKSLYYGSDTMFEIEMRNKRYDLFIVVMHIYIELKEDFPQLKRDLLVQL
ncbi:hypothetical protein BHE74_00039567 [Ensete ventricosum]|nr:hypothetical protein BHE74_00039567 [Ensete ventricosum]